MTRIVVLKKAERLLKEAKSKMDEALSLFADPDADWEKVASLLEEAEKLSKKAVFNSKVWFYSAATALLALIAVFVLMFINLKGFI